ncbi:Solute carrier family 22 member 17 [Anabarilius grahami]|uniref:Solute carrier family 22 member 17 n=1 Tax=Anabarilius grahami TaxID=495550 RepID=A0A3N0XTI7_ANAGA|nr:Solute carrier family 22 member 17 [Anabarilius grahami]
MEFEAKIYPQVGGYGRYNRIITLFSWFPNFAVSLNLFSDVFFTLVPESFHCKPDVALLPLGNLSRQAYLNLTVPWLKGSGFSHCELYKYPGNVSNFTGNVPRDVVSCTGGWEYAKPAGLQNNLVTEWNLVCADYWKIPLQHICFMTGWTLGYILLGTLCDWLGRRCALLLSVLLSGLLGVMICLSNSPSVFPFLRLCQGSMLAGVFLSSYIAHSWCLWSVASLRCLQSFCCRGLQCFAVIGQYFRLSPHCPCCCCCPIGVFPESPRWLLATSQIPQAKKCLQSFSVRNGLCVSDELFPAETLLSEIDEAFPEDIQPEYHHVVELRHTRVIWKNCLILGFTLFIGTGIQYCFTRNLHIYSPHFYFSYFLRVLTGALACIFLCVSVDRFGRRGMLLLSAIVTGLSSLLLLALTQCKSLFQRDTMLFQKLDQ